jgi:SAM-dependent methyltransferase
VEIYRQHGCKTLLDLGCGTGRHVVHLEKAGFWVCGLDNAPTGLRLTQGWLQEEKLSAALVQADMRVRLPFREAAFDGILSTQVIHHARLGVVRRTIAELKRVLAPGGVVFVSVPVRFHPEEAHQVIEPGTYLPLEGPEHGLPHHIFTPEELRAEFDDLAVQEVSVRGDVVIALTAIKKK